MRTCVLFLEWSLLTRLSTSLSSSSSSSTSCLSRRLMRSPWKISCATPAWGAWSLWTMSHSSQRQFEKVLLKHVWEKIPNWECLLVHREKGLFLSVYVDDIKLAGKKHNIDPMWKVLNKEVDLGEPTSFLDHVYLGCTQRQCEVSKDIVDSYRTMFESRISAGGLENYHSLKTFVFPHGLMQRNVWSDIVSWRTRRHSNSTKYLLHASMTTTSKRKKQNLLEHCQIHALKLF